MKNFSFHHDSHTFYELLTREAIASGLIITFILFAIIYFVGIYIIRIDIKKSDKNYYRAILSSLFFSAMIAVAIQYYLAKDEGYFKTTRPVEIKVVDKNETASELNPKFSMTSKNIINAKTKEPLLVRKIHASFGDLSENILQNDTDFNRQTDKIKSNHKYNIKVDMPNHNRTTSPRDKIKIASIEKVTDHTIYVKGMKTHD